MEKIGATLDTLNSSGSWHSLLDETHSMQEQRFVMTPEKELLIEAGRIGACLERSAEKRLEEQRAIDPRPARIEALFSTDVDPWMNRLLKSNSEPINQAQRCALRTCDNFTISRNQLPNPTHFSTMSTAQRGKNNPTIMSSTPEGAAMHSFGSVGGIAQQHSASHRRTSVASATDVPRKE